MKKLTREQMQAEVDKTIPRYSICLTDNCFDVARIKGYCRKHYNSIRYSNKKNKSKLFKVRQIDRSLFYQKTKNLSGLSEDGITFEYWHKGGIIGYKVKSKTTEQYYLRIDDNENKRCYRVLG